MKTYLEPTVSDADDLDSCETKATESRCEAPVNGETSMHFRLLRSNELVVAGDFILNKNHEFEPWEGPAGFRADSFVMAVYRQIKRKSTANNIPAKAQST